MTLNRIGYAHTADIESLARDSTSWSIFVRKQPRTDNNGIEVFAKVALSSTTKFRDADALTTTQVEGALCAWEWMIEESNKPGSTIEEYFEGLGSVAMRWCAMQAGHIACQVHDHMTERGYEFADAYDWQFVPAVLRKLDWKALTEDNQFNAEPYKPDIHAIFCAMVAADMAAQTDPTRRSFQKTGLTFDQYTFLCRAEAERQWGYPDLVSDHPEKVRNACVNDENPADFIKWLGEKYDLTPKQEMGLAS